MWVRGRRGNCGNTTKPVGVSEMLFGEVWWTITLLVSTSWSDFLPYSPQDLKEEGQVLQVGSLGPRWVLAQHAEPWLLTVTSKPWSQSCVPLDKLKGQHNIFSMRKRSRREAPQETEEPPAKKSAAEKREGEEKEKATSGKPRKKVDKEPRKTQEERTDEGSKDKSVNVEEEGGKQTLPEEGGEKKGGQEKVEAEKKGRGKEKELRAREDGVDEERDEASSPPAEPDGDDE